MAIEKMLVVDDEPLICQFLAETLRRKNIEVMTAENGTKALAILKEHPFDMVITDMKMPDMTGLDLLRKIKESYPSTLVVVITAFGSVENAVEAMRLGAHTYLMKPFTPDTIEAIVDKAKEHLALVAENHYLREQVSPCMVGESPSMKKIWGEVQRIAKSNASVMITGESGTGKEVIAQAIHSNSLRNDRAFIKVNCAAVPETLIESEFFGHEKGSFTGAHARRQGRFELAHNGTLLLDEVTEIPLALQAKLLRVLQEQEFERVGGTKPIKVDVRILATSNRNLQEAIADKVLREDLYYRLNVVPIHLPPLRDRREDILPLAEHFLSRFSVKERKEFTAAAKKNLLQYNWPGNVRELANIIERAVVLSPSHKIEIDLEGSQTTASGSLPVGITLQELEKRFIIETLRAQQENRCKAAEQLGISERMLASKLSKL